MHAVARGSDDAGSQRRDTPNRAAGQRAKYDEHVVALMKAEWIEDPAQPSGSSLTAISGSRCRTASG